MKNLLLTCLLGFTMIHHIVCQPRIELYVMEQPDRRNIVVTKYFPAPYNYWERFPTEITSPSMPSIPSHILRESVTTEKDHIRAEGLYEIPVIGIQYIFTAYFVGELGSGLDIMEVFRGDFVYNSAPLPPRYFNMSVEGDSANFTFTPPSNQSENGKPAFYDYLVITCSSYYNWTAEDEQTVSRIINKTSDLVNRNGVTEASWLLTDRLRGLFKHGSFIKCKLHAAAVQDITKYSQSLESSFVIAPRPPKSMAIDLIDGDIFISLDLGNLSTNIFDTVYLNSSDNPTAIVQLSTQNVTHPVKWRSLLPGTVNTFHCWTGVDINGKHYLSSHISADWPKYYNDDNYSGSILIIVLGMILFLTVTVLIAGCFRIRKWKALSQVHSKCNSKPRISISAQSSDQELEEWMVKMQTIKRSREMKNITIFPPKLNTLEEKSTYYYTFNDESAFTAG